VPEALRVVPSVASLGVFTAIAHLAKSEVAKQEFGT
jgi:hypothetical protein